VRAGSVATEETGQREDELRLEIDQREKEISARRERPRQAPIPPGLHLLIGPRSDGPSSAPVHTTSSKGETDARPPKTAPLLPALMHYHPISFRTTHRSSTSSSLTDFSPFGAVGRPIDPTPISPSTATSLLPSELFHMLSSPSGMGEQEQVPTKSLREIGGTEIESTSRRNSMMFEPIESPLTSRRNSRFDELPKGGEKRNSSRVETVLNPDAKSFNPNPTNGGGGRSRSSTLSLSGFPDGWTAPRRAGWRREEDVDEYQDKLLGVLKK